MSLTFPLPLLSSLSPPSFLSVNLLLFSPLVLFLSFLSFPLGPWVWSDPALAAGGPHQGAAGLTPWSWQLGGHQLKVKVGCRLSSLSRGGSGVSLPEGGPYFREEKRPHLNPNKGLNLSSDLALYIFPWTADQTAGKCCDATKLHSYHQFCFYLFMYWFNSKAKYASRWNGIAFCEAVSKMYWEFQTLWDIKKKQEMKSVRCSVWPCFNFLLSLSFIILTHWAIWLAGKESVHT